MKRLSYLALGLTLLLANHEGIADPGSAGEPWFHRSLVGMEVGPTGAQFGHSDPTDTRYCRHFDGREIVRRAVAAGSDYLVAWARDGDYAYYDSKLLPKAPGLGERDPLREALEEARRHHLPIIAYCVVQQGGHFLEAHPEFQMRGANGNAIGRFCLNSGYLEAMKAIVAEQLAYGIEGFHIDMLDQGFGPPYGCWCETCQGEFGRRFGHEMPDAATWDEAWDQMLEFRYATSDRFEQLLSAHIKSINPRATVDFNYHGNPPFSFEVGQRPVQHASNGDFVTGETGAWGFSALTVGLNAAFYRAATPGKPVQVAMQRGVRMYHDQTTRPLADIRWELFTLLAHGTFVTMVDKTGFDGSMDPIAYERVGAAFAEARAKRAHFGHDPIQDVGLYYSSRSRDWIGREQAQQWMQSFLGAQKAVVYGHIPYGVILDENVTLEALRRFPIVLLPNTNILSEAEVALFRSYVEAGGKLIATGHTGQFDRMGKPLADPAFAQLVGARISGRLDSLDNWVRFAAADEDEGVIARDMPHDWSFLVKGPASIYQPGSALPLGKLLKPSRTTRQTEGKEGTEWPMSPDAPVGPAILINQIGDGIVLTIAASPDFATASEHHTVEARRLITDAVRFLQPSPRIRIEAPANVETIITDDTENRVLRVHFLAYNPTPQTLPPGERPYVIPGLIEEAPIFKARITTQEAIGAAAAWNRSTQIDRDGQSIHLLIADIHEVIQLSY